MRVGVGKHQYRSSLSAARSCCRVGITPTVPWESTIACTAAVELVRASEPRRVAKLLLKRGQRREGAAGTVAHVYVPFEVVPDAARVRRPRSRLPCAEADSLCDSGPPACVTGGNRQQQNPHCFPSAAASRLRVPLLTTRICNARLVLHSRHRRTMMMLAGALRRIFPAAAPWDRMAFPRSCFPSVSSAFCVGIDPGSKRPG